MMRLHDLLEPWNSMLPLLDEGVGDVEIQGVTHDSRRVEPGDLYVSIRGERFDGRCFVPEALRRGAVAVLAEDPPLDKVDVPWVRVEELRTMLAPLAARLYDNPQDKLCMVGITGTNGKSTVATLVGHILDAAGRPAGVLGTLGYRFAGRSFDGEADNSGLRTTPEATDFYRTLEAMRNDGAVAVAMEVSSHALQLGRVDGATFEVGVFTNLTHDHLDFHGDIESYFQAKRRLFGRLADSGRAVLCTDGAYGRRLLEEWPDALTFGVEGHVGVVAEQLDYSGMHLHLRTPRGPLEVSCQLLGAYNRDNVLAAVATAEALQLPQAAIIEGLRRQKPLPGRLEPIDVGQSFPALVDYAHTPDALRAVLDSLRQLGTQKLAVVFGCGGDRDPSKRQVMGQIVGERADLVVATSDNPRGEDPMAILAAVKEGLWIAGHSDPRVCVDRHQAIRQAVSVVTSSTDEDWVVLVAGKGHETVQILADRVETFDDRVELAAAIRVALQAVDKPQRAVAMEVSRGRA